MGQIRLFCTYNLGHTMMYVCQLVLKDNCGFRIFAKICFTKSYEKKKFTQNFETISGKGDKLDLVFINHDSILNSVPYKWIFFFILLLLNLSVIHVRTVGLGQPGQDT
jgi:hypothetical protein